MTEGVSGQSNGHSNGKFNGQMTFDHSPHPHIYTRKPAPPTLAVEHLPNGNPINRFNSRLALRITKVVGSMWCAYAFGAFDLISLPTSVHEGAAAIVSWVASTFLQLVLLSVIMVGQNIDAIAAEKRADLTYKDAEAVLHESLQIQEHLQVQDELLSHLVDAMTKLQKG